MITVLDKRGWVLANPEWFMNEVVFHRENHLYFQGKKLVWWKLDQPQGKVIIE